MRRRFKAQSELDDLIVAHAIKDAWDLAAAAGKRASILSTRPTPEQLEHAQKEIGFGFRRPAELPPDATTLNQDLISGAIPTSKPGNNAPANEQPPAAPRRFTIEE